MVKTRVKKEGLSKQPQGDDDVIDLSGSPVGVLRPDATDELQPFDRVVPTTLSKGCADCDLCRGFR